MMQSEKDKLLELFSEEGRWCQNAEARNGSGHPVHYNDQAAYAWDLVGGMCHLFGWERACDLFVQMSRTAAAEPRDRAIKAMVQLQDFNDDANTTFSMVREKILDMQASPDNENAPA